MKFSREITSDETTISGQDYLDHLPDALLLVIFNKVLDAKSLVRCLAVSKRFRALIPQIDTIRLTLPRQRLASSSAKPAKLLKSLLRFFHSVVSAKPRTDSRRKVLYHSPSEVLRGFAELKSLHLELPCCKAEVGLLREDSVLKWKAEFGANLKSCVIFGANSVRKEAVERNDTKEKQNDNQNALTDDELKLRIVWMISSLIAASARHYLAKRVVSELPTLSNVVVSDGDRRGRVSIGGDELSELRRAEPSDVAGDVAAEANGERSLIPDLGMKLWHVPRLVLPGCGWVMEGATLVVIRPLDRGAATKWPEGKERELSGSDGFDGDGAEMGVLGEAIREIVKMKKTYVMEMTSF